MANYNRKPVAAPARKSAGTAANANGQQQDRPETTVARVKTHYLRGRVAAKIAAGFVEELDRMVGPCLAGAYAR
jgi:hypothetical protein